MNTQLWTLFPPTHQLDLNQETWLYNNKDPEYHYALHVLRLASGSAVHVTDGNGLSALGMIEYVDKKILHVKISERRLHTWGPFRMHVALALPKPSALNEVMEIATTFGASSIWLFKGHKSQFNQPLKPERYMTAIKETLRVSKSPLLPLVHTCQDAPHCLRLLQQHLPQAAPFFCDEQDSLESINLHLYEKLGRHMTTAGDCILWIGPEAGWSPEERHLLHLAPAHSVSLGRFILRVPQAVACALTIAQTYGLHEFKQLIF